MVVAQLRTKTCLGWNTVVYSFMQRSIQRRSKLPSSQKCPLWGGAVNDSIKQHLQPADLSPVTIILHFETSEGYFLMACEPLAICKIALENSFKIPIWSCDLVLCDSLWLKLWPLKSLSSIFKMLLIFEA